MKTILETLLRLTETHTDSVLVSIIAREGSAPRGVGSCMLVAAGGRICGTVGGGILEKLSEERAQRLLAERRSDRHTYPLHRDTREDIGSVCGGDVTVMFQFISGTDPLWRKIAQQGLARMALRQRSWLVQQQDGSAPALLDDTGAALAGAAPEHAAALLGEGCILTDSCFSSLLPVGERAIIFGAGHCSLALTPVLASVGFRVTVVDDRPEYADPALFPSAEAVICGDFRHIDRSVELRPEDYAVVMTSGHRHDFEVEEQLLRRPLAYVGVIGSRAKTAAVNQKLREAGISEETIAAVHAPVGVAIKAVTPQEIAVSIAGEMILIRALHREEAGQRSHACPMH